jgi:lysophospholipase L1-like esterase
VSLVTLAALALAGCTPGAPDTIAVRPTVPQYVALGDSYTSGAGMSDVVVKAGSCGQSRKAYPFLVAEARDLSLVDMSCGNATTEDGTTAQTRPDGRSWPPQLSVLTKQTELVTVSIGLNDFSLFQDAVAGCASLASSDPTGSPCADDPRTAGWSAYPAQIGQRIAAYLGEVRTRAPKARIVVVGYPQIVPSSGTCPELPLAPGDYAFVRGLLEQAVDAQRQAAADAGVTYVDVYAQSAGHDICAGDDAWINGAQPQQDAAAAYHPFDTYQSAVAGMVEDALG